MVSQNNAVYKELPRDSDEGKESEFTTVAAKPLQLTQIVKINYTMLTTTEH